MPSPSQAFLIGVAFTGSLLSLLYVRLERQHGDELEERKEVSAVESNVLTLSLIDQ